MLIDAKEKHGLGVLLGFKNHWKPVGSDLNVLTGGDDECGDRPIFLPYYGICYHTTSVVLDMGFSRLLQDVHYLFPAVKATMRGLVHADKLVERADRVDFRLSAYEILFRRDNWSNEMCPLRSVNFVMGDVTLLTTMAHEEADEWMDTALAFTRHVFSEK